MSSGDFLLNVSGSVQKWNQAGSNTPAANGDLLMSFAPAGAGVANGAGRLGAMWDRGTGALVEDFNFGIRTQANAAPAVGAAIRLYFLCFDDTAMRPGGFGAVDAAISTENDLLNAAAAFSVICDAASNSRVFALSGALFLRTRYVIPAIWNASGQALHNTSTNHELIVYPRPPQVQP